MELYEHQISAVKRMHNGCILNGGVGSGKSRAALTYFFFVIAKGKVSVNGKGTYQEPKFKVPLYIITTARKRDTKDWESEMAPFLMSPNPKDSVSGIEVHVDSWNNIRKYQNVHNSFFIFDEQRVVGNGSWVKAFLKITKVNQWILLSATPGDTWKDYIPVFIANGFYKNRTEFMRNHAVFNRYTKYPKIDRYVNEGRLIHLRNLVLVDMDYEKKTTRHNLNILVDYDRIIYKTAMKTRWNIFKDEPCKQVSDLCYVLRRIVNTSDDRKDKLREILNEHKRSIVFYNFNYELDELKVLGEDIGYDVAEWNGHKHEPIPDSQRWIYLVQYTAGAEGWNCTTTDTTIFFSQNYSYKTMEQASGRIDRLNTPFKDLYYYHLISNSGIDAAIYKALKKKQSFNENKYFKF